MTQRSKIKSFCFMAILGLILGVMAVFCAACNKESATGITVTGLPENNVAVITDSNNTLQLGYDILGGKGNVEWRSGDEDVALVDASGKVVLIDSGAVVITATLKNNAKIKAEVLLTIKDERTITDTITLSGMPETNTVQYGDEPLQLSATCSNVQATLVWTSSDMTVATVNDSGLVSFVGGGSTEITVYKKGQRAVKASATLTVIRNVESVTICDIDGGTVVVGYDYRLNKVYEYALQTEYSPWNASAFELEWSVDDTNIATIDENGILTGKQSGRVTVTAQVKDSEVKATKEFDVVALNDKSEDFSYAVANRCIVGSVCADAWVDYTGTKVTSQNTDLFIETYDNNKRMLRVEKNTDWVHWSHICLGSWNLVPGKYILTLDMEVINGAFEGKINGAQYNSTPAEYENGIRPDAIGELAFGTLSQFKAENGQYVIEFELTKSYENFGIMLYDSVSKDPYALNIKSFSLSVADFAVDTDIYSDGMLILGEEYKFVPAAIADGMTFDYKFTGNENGIVELKDGKLIPKKVGNNVKLTVSTDYNGNKLTKEFDLSVIANPFNENEDDYSYAVDVTNRGNLVYDVMRTSVYLRTHNWIMSIEDYNNGKTLKLKKDYAPAWDGSVQFMLGDVKKGTYAVSFTLHGDDMGNWNKFQGHIYPITWNADYETTFSAEAYTRGQTPYGNIFDTNCVKQGNTYTYTITLTEDINNFGIELCGGTTVDYTVYLDAFKFEKLPAVTGVEIQTDLKTTIKTGEQANLNVSVTYEGGASKGQEYTAEWKTSGEGTVRIAEDGTLTAVAPGSVTIELNVVCADGKTFQKTLTVTVEVGEISIETDMYDDGLLVKGEEYSFIPEKFTDESVFEYSYSADGIVKVENGKLTALKAGDVTVTVTETVTGAKKEISIKVKEYGGWEDANYADATNAKNRVESGTCIYDVERTNVYLRTFNMTAAVEDYNSGKTLKLAQDYQTAWAGSVLFMLGDVKKGTYAVSFTLHGSDIGNWNKFQGYIYPITWNANYETTFSAEAYSRRGTTPYGNIFDANCVKQGNTYTYTITITEDINNFGIELCGGEPMGYTFYLDAFKFEKLPVVTGAEMNVTLTDNKMQTGDKVDLAETVTYAEGATKGENYIAEWSVENGTGTARIESGKLVAVSAGNVTLKLHVVSASGAEFDKSLNITIELGEVIVEHDMYEDGILVKDKGYKFEPQNFSDDSVFEYTYSAENIVKVENGKLIAIGVGDVTLTVTETVTGAAKEFKLQVVDFSGNKDEDYRYAVNPTQHGDFFDIERTNVYLRTFNMNISVNENKLTLTKNYVPASGASVFFYLGNVEAGRYCITVNLGGDLAWNQFKGYLYPLNMNSDWQTMFGDGAYKKGSEPYGNIHTAGFCLYSGESSTAGGTYKMFIDVASAQTDFGLMLETWGTENTSFAITLGSFSFERQELPKMPDFSNASVYKHGEGITVTGSNGSMAVTKAASDASVTEEGVLRVVTPNAWSEIALCFGKVKAGTYTLSLDISAVDMSGNYWFTGLVYYGTCKNGNISYNGETGLLSENAAEVTHAATARTVNLTVTVAEDTENFAIILASKGDCGQPVNVALTNISLVGNTEA